MKCYVFFFCFQEKKKTNCFCIFTKKIATADSSYLLRKTHCLMLLSFVSRQCLKLWIELSFNQPAVTPTTEESTGQVLVWPRCHFTSYHPRRSNPSTCDSACAPGPWCCWPQQALLHRAAWVHRVPRDPLSQDMALVSVPALNQPRQKSYSAGRKLQSKWHSVPMSNICSPAANSGNMHLGKHAALCTGGFFGVDKTLMTHPLTASYTHPKKIKSITLTQLANQKLVDVF